MASSITTYNGMRCTRILQTQYFRSISTSAATDSAGFPKSLSSSIDTTTSISQSTLSTSTSSITALAATVTSTSSTIAATILPASTSDTSPSSTQISANDPNPNGRDSKKDIVAVAVGASMGAVAVVALVILFAYLRRRKRRMSHMDDGEKPRHRCCGFGQFPNLAQLVNWLKQKLEDKAKSRFAKKVRHAVVAGVWHRRSRNKDTQNGEGVQAETEPETIENDIRASLKNDETRGRNILSVPPRTTRDAHDISADLTSNANATMYHQRDRRSENPFSDPGETSIWTDFSDDNSIFQPLTVRNADVDVDDSDDDHHHNNLIPTMKDGKTTEKEAGGSALNLANARGSSPLVPDFKSGLENGRLDQKPKDRTSAYSDPFDLERPLTIHSSAHPTPKVESKSREGYFPEEHQARQHIS